jgi:putative NADH-flavin reductase
MKVLVLGAGGKTGHLVAERALAAGHEVVALVHGYASDDTDDMHQLPVGVDVVHGDAQNPSRLKQAMEGCEAVVDTIGGKTPFKHTDLEAGTAKVVLEAMAELGVKRLIVISALGVGESVEQAGFFYEHLLMPTFLRGTMKDKAEMEAEVTRSGVEWVIVRPPILTDGEATGSVQVVAGVEHANRITRADLATFIVDQLTSNEWVGKAVTITNW